MAYLKKEKAKIFYQIFGANGPWVTLINGYTRSSQDFKLIAKQLCAAGFRVLTFDNRGSGRTETLPSFSFTEMVNDVEALWKAEAISRSHVVAFSMGGIIAQWLASKQSKYFSSLVLVASARSLDHLSKASDWGDSVSAIEEQLQKYFHASFSARNRPLIRAMAENINSANAKGEFAAKARQQRAALAEIQGQLAELRSLRCKSLVIHGANDQITAVQYAIELSDALPNSRCIIYPDSGHLLLLERRQELLKDIIDHLQRSSPA